MLSGVASIIGMLSDKRAKTNIHDGNDMLHAVADSVRGKSFNYKESPDRQEYGIMAQDLEKTPLKGMVNEDQNGMKRIDTQRLTTANTAMISELSKKMDKALAYMGRQK
jgi:hypothetical protein